MKKINLVVEKAEGGVLWGRVEYDDNLIVESANNMNELQAQVKVLLFDFHELEPAQVEFEISYDLTSFFEVFSYLKISKIAEVAGLNPSLLRHYVAGSKTASSQQVSKIQEAIRRISAELTTVEFA